ncbi:Helicase associated domain protein, partial [Streptomyces sp. NPDC005151]
IHHSDAGSQYTSFRLATHLAVEDIAASIGTVAAVDDETEPMVVKLGVWVSNTRARRDKLTQEQLEALRELGVEWA